MNGGFRYLWNVRLTERDPGILCPEKPERLIRLDPKRIAQSVPGLPFGSFDPKLAGILEAVHRERYIEEVRTAEKRGRRALDSGDTRVTPNLFEDALLSASAGCTAVDTVFNRECDRVFCAIRPPGHHANAVRALGFCVFNNAAIAARYAQNKYQVNRVLILDWDVHPGNGTQEIFYEDDSVFTLSFHQADHFSEAGREDLTGKDEGEGFNRNVAFEPGTDAAAYHRRFEQVLDEVCESFCPNLIIIAAGFDGHQRDPASELGLLEEDFATLTEVVLRQADTHTAGRVISVLEGGYNFSTLQLSVINHCRVLASWT